MSIKECYHVHEKIIRQGGIKRMTAQEEYKYHKTEELTKEFNKLRENLSLKHNTKFEISTYYDCIFVNGMYGKLKDKFNSIAKDIIEFAKSNMNEQYNMPITGPAIHCNWQGISPNSMCSYLMHRILKENEPV